MQASLNGNWLIIGAPGGYTDFDGCYAEEGEVFIYEWRDARWYGGLIDKGEPKANLGTRVAIGETHALATAIHPCRQGGDLTLYKFDGQRWEKLAVEPRYTNTVTLLDNRAFASIYGSARVYNVEND